MDLDILDPSSIHSEQPFGLGSLNEQGSLLENEFFLPGQNDPSYFIKDFNNRQEKKDQIHMSKGTTTLGFMYQGGVLIAVDSRATMGPYISSGTVKKVIEINQYLLGTMAGGAADCAFWERELGRQCRVYELKNKERISVAAASKILGNILYYYRGYGLSVGTMIAGWDKSGPNLFYVDNDGTRLQGNKFSVGSGSLYAYSILDSGYRWDLTDEEAYELGRRAIFHATHRDAASGGVINVYHIRQDGWHKISSQDNNELFWNQPGYQPVGSGAGEFYI
eukprot:TRINITY_DN1514_c0_g1_i1.p1 TRINITY_DN1514_c0_g1~~TRINITY_DN1514_c0_g1_i1.p1  ORF type:complete len:292 (-),score=89.14 TRINITY_DN1514_c0_g1_i1:93-926(-)